MKTSPKSNILRIDALPLPNGISVAVDGREFRIEYPGEVWQNLPPSLRDALTENLVFGFTHFLPLTLGRKKIRYNTRFPFLESYLFRNQLCDMGCCEKADHVKPLTYFRDFYNLEFEFAKGESAIPMVADLKPPRPEKPIAVLPFTFGKESLTTFALCQELGITPVIVYSQEPSQPYEEDYKAKKLKEFGQKFGVETYLVKNGPGLFRYDAAFKVKPGTEIGWGSQTTLLAMLCVPIAYKHGARYILFGSEFANNEYEMKRGWKVYSSYDQTSFWTKQQTNMVRLLTGNHCSAQSSLEPIDEVNIFYLLHHRYPEIGKYQFSCSAEHPLLEGSQWCHECYKCVRMFLFARATGVDPFSIGFKKDLLRRLDLFEHYFGTVYKSGSSQELDFAFFLAYKRGVKAPAIEKFAKEKLKHLKPWKWYREHYTHLKPEWNLPEKYREKMLKIFEAELRSFEKMLPA